MDKRIRVLISCLLFALLTLTISTIIFYNHNEPFTDVADAANGEVLSTTTENSGEEILPTASPQSFDQSGTKKKQLMVKSSPTAIPSPVSQKAENQQPKSDQPQNTGGNGNSSSDSNANQSNNLAPPEVMPTTSPIPQPVNSPTPEPTPTPVANNEAEIVIAQCNEPSTNCTNAVNNPQTSGATTVQNGATSFSNAHLNESPEPESE